MTAATPTGLYAQRHLAAGYRYQDLIAALSMASVLAYGGGAVAVEQKRFKGDVFDDVVISRAGQVPRRGQVKHRKSGASITRALFVDDADGLQFDRLMARTPRDAGGVLEPELRVITTLTSADAQAEGFVAAPDVPPFATGLVSTRWRLQAKTVWPEEDAAAILPLPAGASRDDLESFCRRFIIEADVMPMSGALARPGPLELALVAQLRDEVGVEQYPNRADVFDVASRLLEVAGSLRTRTERAIEFEAIAGECGLRIDRGRVPQAFPLDRRRYVPHVPLRAALATALAQDHRRIVVQGSPGAGKSWTLEATAQDLRTEGWLVARHYCFLAPGDPEVAQRVAVESMTANLTAELFEDARLEGVSAGLGGGLASLELLLKRADPALGSCTDRICLIVDGLDHAARVELPSGAAPVSPEDLTAQLGLLEIPDRVTLIVGSQPGAHLKTLKDRGAHVLTTPPLKPRHIAALLARQGVLRELKARGLADDHGAMVAAAHRKAAGNPLYAGFLGREVLQRLGAGQPAAPSEIISSISGVNGDLADYYRHLLATATNAPDDGLVAEHLALLDFPLTVVELDEILPSLGRPRLERVVSALRPILDDVGTQGGLRIHHESFRRFIVQRLTAEGRRMRSLLDPLVTWLEGRGFFRDERAFRYLLPLLRRAERPDDVLNRIGPDFVSRSVVELQPGAAIEANLRLAAGVAAAARDFPALTRVAELRSALTTTFREKLSDPTTWAEAVVELNGAERLAARLLYDGRPTWPREAGLRLCAIVDRACRAAPWREYLAMPRETSNQTRLPEEKERYALDEVRGGLRTRSRDDSIARVASWIGRNPDAPESFFGGLAAELVDVLGFDAIAATLDAATGASKRARCQLELGLAEALSAAGENEQALAAGWRALGADLPSAELRRLLDIGIPSDELGARCPQPDDLRDALLSDRDPDVFVVDAFLTSVLLAAGSGTDLAETRAGLAGDGFYRAWLRFCCDLAEARAGGTSIVDALEELGRYDEPFVGTPRACDLYRIHGLTVETFRRAAEVVDDDEWSRALDLLLTIAANTTTSMQNNPSGPLTVWSLLELLLPYARRIPLDAVHQALECTWRNQFYEFHAEASLRVGRLEHRAGRPERAAAMLGDAGRYLAAYGFHKDVTVFGLIEALEAITDSEHRAAVSARFRSLFPLCDRARRHSDGRETGHASTACFAAFARHTPGAAADSLARTFLEDPPARYHDNEDALKSVLAVADELVPPHLHHLVWRCCPAADASKWLTTIDRLALIDAPRAREAFAELGAAADGDTEARQPSVAQLANEFAADRGWPELAMDRVPDRRRRATSSDPSHHVHGARSGPHDAQGPFFEGARTALELLVLLRRRETRSLDDQPLDPQVFADELVARLRQVTGDQPETVADLMEAFCHEQRSLDARGDILARVAADYAQNRPLAAQLYVLAWIGTCAGWDPFGGLPHRDLLAEAFALDADVACGRLAREFGWQIQTASYMMGITRRASEAMVIAGRPGVAVACWDEAAAVIEHRLPATGAERPAFAAPREDIGEPETPHAYAHLLGALVHSSDPDRRSAALAGIAELLPSEPELAGAAVEPVLSADATFTDTLLVFRLLELATDLADPPLDIVERLPAIAARPGFGLQQAAGALLELRGEARTLRTRPLPARARSLSQAKIDEALIWDARNRVQRLAGLWQPFARKVAARYWDLFEADREETLRIIEHQADSQFSRSEPWVPPWPLHRWEAELLEIAVHDTVPDLISHLAANGRWPAAQTHKIHEMLSPDLGAAVAHARSRTVRPTDVALADDREDRIGPPVRVTDQPNARWLRVALIEQELRPHANSMTEGTLTRVISGLWSGTQPDAADTPLGRVLTTWRWHTQESASSGRLTGPMAINCEDQHLVLYDALLSLAPAWLARLGLRPATLPAPLDLVDEDGAVAAVLRCWRMRPHSYEYSPPSPMIRGAELLLRPDLSDIAVGATPLIEVTRVTRHELPGSHLPAR